MGQLTGTLLGLITAFIISFIVLTFGAFMPAELISTQIVDDFLRFSDLELKLAITGTVLFPSAIGATLGDILGLGARSWTVLMFLSWGIGGLAAGLLSRDIIQGVFAAVFAAAIGALLTWILIFVIQTSDFGQILGTSSLIIMQSALEGIIYPCIVGGIGGLLGGAITRER
ncbi:MAG: conserved membrane protein of unknown function [Candidatus Thorarchaeota archaeon]|nr:MAG: conserved membrane protein of unknown function [Candidatus Thorarchaeota archaeon]